MVGTGVLDRLFRLHADELVSLVARHESVEHFAHIWRHDFSFFTLPNQRWMLGWAAKSQPRNSPIEARPEPK